MILSDKDIVKKIKDNLIKIEPFIRSNVQPSTVDLTLDSKIRIFENHTVGIVDIKKKQDISVLVDMGKKGWFILHPGDSR